MTGHKVIINILLYINISIFVYCGSCYFVFHHSFKIADCSTTTFFCVTTKFEFIFSNTVSHSAGFGAKLVSFVSVSRGVAFSSLFFFATFVDASACAPPFFCVL